MKIKIITVLVFAAFSVQANAQIRESYQQHIALWLGGGYAQLSHNIDQTSVTGGYGGLFGLGYHGGYKHFIFKLGGEIYHLNSTTTFGNFRETITYYHPPVSSAPQFPNGIPMDFHYTFDKFRDTQSATYVNFPLMVGLKFGNFYTMVGAKYGLFLSGGYHLKGTFSTIADDPMFWESMVNIPAHGIANGVLRESDGELKFKSNIVASAEVGFYLDKLIYEVPHSPSLRLALFADYGIPDIQDNPIVGTKIQYPYSGGIIDPLDVSVLPVFTSTEAYKKPVNSLLVGLKLTVMFKLPEPGECHCEW